MDSNSRQSYRPCNRATYTHTHTGITKDQKSWTLFRIELHATQSSPHRSSLESDVDTRPRKIKRSGDASNRKMKRSGDASNHDLGLRTVAYVERVYRFVEEATRLRSRKTARESTTSPITSKRLTQPPDWSAETLPSSVLFEW